MACAGGVENCLRRQFGLPVLSSVQPERFLMIPVQIFAAWHKFRCPECYAWVEKGQAIANSTYGFAHARCLGLRQPRVVRARYKDTCPICKNFIEMGQAISASVW